MNQSIEKILFSEEQIASKVKELGAMISRDYAGKEIMVLCILKGAFVFASDLFRSLTIPAGITFMSVSSYGCGTVSSGVIKIDQDIDLPIEGKHIIIAEDIVDSGKTLSYIVEYLKNKKAASVEICAIFDKPDRREVPVEVKYIGYQIPNEFVVGYGLDYAEQFRNLPYLGILKRSLYETH